MLVITIGGGLAANVATVILVGAAIAFVHLARGAPVVWVLPLTLCLAVAGIFGIAAGNLQRRHPSRRVSGWITIAMASPLLLEAVLFWIGLASGVK
jgi:hypothetical protein